MFLALPVPEAIILRACCPDVPSGRGMVPYPTAVSMSLTRSSKKSQTRSHEHAGCVPAVGERMCKEQDC